jgi:hypothetical protein
MGRWSDRLHAYIETRDTVDTVDSAFRKQVADVASVNTVNSVTPTGRASDDELAMSRPSEVSTLSTVSTNGETDGHGAITPTDVRLAALKRPVSWANVAARPTQGSYCSCCRGQRWWCEREAPKGWRCWRCHPPSGLSAAVVEDVRT